MRRVRWARLGWGAALACSAAHATAQPAQPPAATPPASYALSWVRGEGAEACPAARTLAAEVERRLGRPVFEATAARSFEVQVTRVAGAYRSDVFVRDESGRAVGHRSLQSDEPGCGALFGATALAIALVIDPEAAAREPGSSSIAAFDVPPTPAPAPAPPPAPPPAPVVVAQPAPAPPPRPARRSTPITVSMRGQLSGGLVPEASPGVGLAFSARPGERWGFALAASYTAPQTARRGTGDFELGLTRVSAAVTLDLAQSRRVRLVLAAGPSLGALHLAIREPAPVTDPGDFLFVAAELGLGLELAVSDAIFMELGGAGLVPLRHQEFSVRDQVEPVWSEPWVAGSLHLGLGARFP